MTKSRNLATLILTFVFGFNECFSCSISGGKQAVNLEYLHHLQNKLIAPLLRDGSAGVPAVMQVMRDYFLTREDLDNILELNQWPGLPDPMSRVESKVRYENPGQYTNFLR